MSIPSLLWYTTHIRITMQFTQLWNLCAGRLNLHLPPWRNQLGIPPTFDPRCNHPHGLGVSQEQCQQIIRLCRDDYRLRNPPVPLGSVAIEDFETPCCLLCLLPIGHPLTCESVPWFLSLFYRIKRQDRSAEDHYIDEASHWLVQDDDRYGMIPVGRLRASVSFALYRRDQVDLWTFYQKLEGLQKVNMEADFELREEVSAD
jgi:hypothetical protein